MCDPRRAVSTYQSGCCVLTAQHAARIFCHQIHAGIAGIHHHQHMLALRTKCAQMAGFRAQ
jgi:hypothetical protein